MCCCTKSVAADDPMAESEDTSLAPIVDPSASHIDATEHVILLNTAEEDPEFLQQRVYHLEHELTNAKLQIARLDKEKSLKARSTITISFASIFIAVVVLLDIVFLAIHVCPNAVEREKIWAESTEWSNKMVAHARSWLHHSAEQEAMVARHSMEMKTLLEASEKQINEKEEQISQLKLDYEEKIKEIENQKDNCEREKAVFDIYMKHYEIFYKIPYVKTTKDLLLCGTLLNAFMYISPYLLYFLYHCTKYLITIAKEGEKSDKAVKENIPLNMKKKKGENYKGTIEEGLYSNEVFKHNATKNEKKREKVLQKTKMKELEVHVELSAIEMKQFETRLEMLEKKLSSDRNLF